MVAETPAGDVLPCHFRIDDAEVDASQLGQGQLLVQVMLVAVEPANAVWMKAASYMPQLQPGDVIPGFAVGQVIASAHCEIAVGEMVEGQLGWQDLSLVDARKVRVRDAAIPLVDMVGLLGISSITAYYGMLEIGRVRAGETVMVSAAGGAVGSVAVQIARLAGCRVVAIAGGRDNSATGCNRLMAWTWQSTTRRDPWRTL